jgi:hypothetical protein
VHELAEDEKLDLSSEPWDARDHSAPVPQWHEEGLDRRLATTEPEAFTAWSDARKRILGSP